MACSDSFLNTHDSLPGVGVELTPPTVEANLQEAFPLMRVPLPSDSILYQVVKLIYTRENLISFIEYISVVCKLL